MLWGFCMPNGNGQNDQGNPGCSEAATSQRYTDFIVETFGDRAGVLRQFDPECIANISNRYVVLHYTGNSQRSNELMRYAYGLIPKLFGLMDTTSMERSGLLQVQQQPFLELTGRDVLIGFVDTGIDFTHPAFTYENQTTKILGLWDQNIPGRPPEGFDYGTEFTEADINQALSQENPFDLVPSQDENGHGTFVAGIAAGQSLPDEDFIGAAPNARLAVVKLKPAKNYLREFFALAEDAVAYQENDIMMGISYLMTIARRYEMPLAICVTQGSNSGGHTGTSYIDRFLNEVAGYRGVAVVTAAGNEGNESHHFMGTINQASEPVAVEIRSGTQENGFTVELWGQSPDVYTLSITSPTGETISRIPVRGGSQQNVSLVLERTNIYILYRLVEDLSGNQMIFIRFTDPTPGVWTLRVYGETLVFGTFNIWLPIKEFIQDDTYFLNPTPDITLTAPGGAAIPITVGAYNHYNNSIYIGTGRGFTADGRIKPDITAPGVSVFGPVPGGGFSTRTGTSIAAAHGAGAAALLLEWGFYLGVDTLMDTNKVKKYFILGAERRPDVVYPNRAWGFGTLNLYNTYETMRLGR